MKAKTLWTKNLTIITLGTLISAIGGIAMNLGLSLVVFDETQSTWLIGLFGAISMLPGLTLPLMMGPVIDRVNRKHVIVALDALSGLCYLLFFAYIRCCGFVYAAYVAFSFLCSCIGSVYSLAYGALYPDLIPEGFEQKGYAVSGVIYPLATTIITPLAALMYARWGVETLILLVSQLVVGALGEVVSYPMAAALLSGFAVVCMLLLIVRNRAHVEPVYNHPV